MQNLTTVRLVLLAMGIAAWSPGAAARADDWPTWRHDARRSATTAEQLPSQLHLNWWRQHAPLTPAWPEDPRLQFDASYEPVVAGKTMYVASSRNDSIMAFDTESGAERWRFHASGPVRFAPIIADEKVYFGADDGAFYCLNAADGSLRWQVDAAPTNRKILGNDRLISVWPMRGGPVLADGKIQFTIGVWPFEGNFLETLDAETGERLASEPTPIADRTSSALQIETLNDLTPQGYLVATKSKLFIPCGRAVAACQDRETGQFISHSYPTRGTTNYHVTATDRWLFHGLVSFDMETKQQLPFGATAPVVTDETVYFAQSGTVLAYDLQNPEMRESKDRRGKIVKNTVLQKQWSLPNQSFNDVPQDDKEFAKWVAAHPVQIDVKAGNRLYGHQDNLVFAIDIPAADETASVSWKTEIEGTPSSMLVADGKLFVVTLEGRLYCFGGEQTTPRTYPLPNADAADRVADAATGAATAEARLIEELGLTHGYCLVLGHSSSTNDTLESLLDRTELELISVDADAKSVAQLRDHFDQTGQYGSRVMSFVGNPVDCGLPPYVANAIVVQQPSDLGIGDDQLGQLARAVFHSLRPYGGTAVLELTTDQHQALMQAVSQAKLPNAEVARAGDLTTLTRVGALPGSADWTHEYGDASNTLMSRDELVKAPLGVLWFGGPSSHGDLFYNRHFWGPSMAVVDGRMFIQGPGKITAVDVYTGRILWQTPIVDDENYRPGRRGNDFERVLAGFHFLVIPDGLYIVHKKTCLRLDPATGKQLAEFKLPKPEDDWGRIRVQDELLITEVFREDPKLGPLCVELAALNRQTGELIWTYAADLSFPVTTVGEDRIFLFDGLLEEFYKDWKRRGLVPKSAGVQRLKAIDIKTGKEIWNYTTDMAVTWINYSQDHDVIMAANKKSMVAYSGKDGGEMWKKYAEGVGFRGHPESYWDRVIIRDNQVIDQRGPGAAYQLTTGEPVLRKHPLTDKLVPWEFTKSGHHCNYAIASPHLLTFRAASAGFCSVDSGATSRLDGFRSGCRNSLIPANGVLNAPNFAHGCSCGYSVFTSLAFTHLPEAEMWSYSPLSLKPNEEKVTRVGVNFGAPGDRLADSGTLWLDYPNVGGSSPPVSIKVQGEKLDYFRQHSSFVQDGDLRWVAASGVEGVTSVTVDLNRTDNTPLNYTVRLHFADPQYAQPQQRLFDIALQGATVQENLDVAAEAQGRQRAITKEFRGVAADRSIVIEFTPRTGRPLLCGVEIAVETAE